MAHIVLHIRFQEEGKKQIKFDFDLVKDTPSLVAAEMVKCLKLADPDSTGELIAESISKHLEDWQPHRAAASDIYVTSSARPSPAIANVSAYKKQSQLHIRQTPTNTSAPQRPSPHTPLNTLITNTLKEDHHTKTNLPCSSSAPLNENIATLKICNVCCLQNQRYLTTKGGNTESICTELDDLRLECKKIHLNHWETLSIPQLKAKILKLGGSESQLKVCLEKNELVSLAQKLSRKQPLSPVCATPATFSPSTTIPANFTTSMELHKSKTYPVDASQSSSVSTADQARFCSIMAKIESLKKKVINQYRSKEANTDVNFHENHEATFYDIEKQLQLLENLSDHNSPCCRSSPSSKCKNSRSLELHDSSPDWISRISDSRLSPKSNNLCSCLDTASRFVVPSEESENNCTSVRGRPPCNRYLTWPLHNQENPTPTSTLCRSASFTSSKTNLSIRSGTKNSANLVCVLSQALVFVDKFAFPSFYSPQLRRSKHPNNIYDLDVWYCRNKQD